MHHRVDVVRTIDGDTFEARVHQSPGRDLVVAGSSARHRCAGAEGVLPEELEKAEAASAALRGLLGEGGVTIFNIGRTNMRPGRRRRRDEEDRECFAALLARGHARSYNGGHRNGWCANAASKKKPRSCAAL